MTSTFCWVDHACRHCWGRLVEITTDDPSGRPVYECGNCSTKAVGEPDSLCGCGIMPRVMRAKGGPRFHCTPNPNRSVSAPAAIIIVFDEESP